MADSETEIRDTHEASCEAGYTGDTDCKACGEKIATGQVIPGTHKLDKVGATPATHEAAGNIEYYICSSCGKIFVDETATTEILLADTVIAKGEHNYGGTYVNNENQHWKACECGNVVDKSAHNYGEWSVTKEATTDEKGIREKVCSVCGYKITEDIPVITENTVTDDANKDDISTDSPATGDTSNIFLWIVLVILSGLGIVFTIIFRKRQVNN